MSKPHKLTAREKALIVTTTATGTILTALGTSGWIPAERSYALALIVGALTFGLTTLAVDLVDWVHDPPPRAAHAAPATPPDRTYVPADHPDHSWHEVTRWGSTR